MASPRVKNKHQRRKRRDKIQKLRRQIDETKDLSKRRQLAAKIKRISRTAPVPE